MPGSGRASWTPVSTEQRVRRPEDDGSGAVSRRARRGGTYEATIPARIAQATVELNSDTAALVEAASSSLARFDQSLAHEVAAFEPLLLRSEAAASSRIEQLTASARAVLTAEATGRSRSGNALAIVSNTRAMAAALALADHLTPEAIREMHAVLMQSEERHTPGRFRTEPVWIGTSSASPIGAEFIGPEHSRIPDLIDDLIAFARRTDIPVLAQTAIAHAQFETIHPFTDGNGRVGRALLQAMLRAGDLTRHVTVPVSGGLLTDVGAYHRALTAYRAGDPAPIIELTADATVAGIDNAHALTDDLHRIRRGWDARVRLRADSAGRRVLDVALRQPVLTAATLAAEVGVAPTNAYRAIRPLLDAQVLTAEREGRAGSVYRADEVLAALDAFAERAGRRRH